MDAVMGWLIFDCINMTILCKPTKVLPFLCEEKLGKSLIVKWSLCWVLFGTTIGFIELNKKENPHQYEEGA